MCNERSLEQTVNIIQRLYKNEISRATAYRDVKNATKLFGEVTKTSKESKRTILQQYCDRIYKIAMRDEDLDAAKNEIPDFTNNTYHIKSTLK